MPVYLLTVHAYHSWDESNPRGYVQRGKGLQPPNPDRARWRRGYASHPPRRFTKPQQRVIHTALVAHTDTTELTLHAASTTSTHLHALVSFKSPACTCGASRKHCLKRCPARQSVEAFTTAMKRSVGGALTGAAKAAEPPDAPKTRRKWFSRGWDITPVRGRGHFDFLLTDYLPKHEREGGMVRMYDT